MSVAAVEAVTSEEEEMGRVTVKAEIANFGDLFLAHRGLLPEDEVRRITVEDALVDTGASTLSMPPELVERLGLGERRRKEASTAGGPREMSVREMARLWVQGRDCTVEVVQLPEEDCPVLIGQVPLELMDWVVDPQGRKLIGNPAHDGEWKLEVF